MMKTLLTLTLLNCAAVKSYKSCKEQLTAIPEMGLAWLVTMCLEELGEREHNCSYFFSF